jgi:hypothetical protein
MRGDAWTALRSAATTASGYATPSHWTAATARRSPGWPQCLHKGLGHAIRLWASIGVVSVKTPISRGAWVSHAVQGEPFVAIRRAPAIGLPVYQREAASTLSIIRSRVSELGSLRCCRCRPKAEDTTAIEIEIGGATLRVGAGVERVFLGKVLRLLKAMK